MSGIAKWKTKAQKLPEGVLLWAPWEIYLILYGGHLWHPHWQITYKYSTFAYSGHLNESQKWMITVLIKFLLVKRQRDIRLRIALIVWHKYCNNLTLPHKKMVIIWLTVQHISTQDIRAYYINCTIPHIWCGEWGDVLLCIGNNELWYDLNTVPATVI